MSDELVFLSRHTIPPAYVIDDLGLLPDGRISHALAINSHGQVVGEADSADGMRAFLWDGDDIADLGTMGGATARAVDINDDGKIIGMAERDGGVTSVPFLFHDGRMIDLEAHGLKSVLGLASISEDDLIVGTFAHAQAVDSDIHEPGETAFRWSYGATTLLTSPAIRWSEAHAINRTSMIAGELYEPAIDRKQAFVWSSGRLVILGSGAALDLNDAGTVAGFATMAGDATLACIWQEHVRRDLPIPSGIAYSQAKAINNRGDVVGTMGTTKMAMQPFLWSREHLIDLNDTIDPHIGWNLRDATDINEAGQIVGWGFRSHRHHAFRMTPNAAA